MSFTYEVDIARKTPSGMPYLEHVADYVILANAKEIHLPNGRVKYTDNQRYYVQHGKIYLGGAEEVAPQDAPAWFWEQYSRITPETRKAVGLALPIDRQRDLESQAASTLAQFDQLPAEVKTQLLAKLGIQSPNENPLGLPDKPSRMLQVETSLATEYKPLPLTEGTATDDPKAPRLKLWSCDECGEETLLRHKGVHKAAHARAAKRLAQKAE